MRCAIRTWIRSPWYFAGAALLLGLGIGTSTALLGIADAVLLKSLPSVDRPAELVLARTGRAPAWPDGDGFVPFALFEWMASGSSAFSRALAVDRSGVAEHMRLTVDAGRPASDTVSAVAVSGSYFETLGVRPAHGRLFGPADDRPGRPLLAVISHGLWERQYGSAAEAIGRMLSLDPATGIGERLDATIAGVAPRGFSGTDREMAPDVWLTMMPARERNGTLSSVGTVQVMARLRPGVTLQQAQREVDAVTREVFDRLIPRSVSGTIYARALAGDPRLRVERAARGYSMSRDDLRQPMLLTMLSAAMILLLTCANVGGLVLARAAARTHDLAVRVSLGSSRLAVAGLLMAEAAVVAVAGGMLGMLVCLLALRALASLVAVEAGWGMAGFDARLFALLILVSLGSLVVWGLIPAIRLSRVPLARLVASPAAGGVSIRQWHRAILIGQMATSFVLVASAGLFLRTIEHLDRVDTGFDRRSVLQFSVAAPPDRERRTVGLSPALFDALDALPDVEMSTWYSRTGLLQETGRPILVTAIGPAGRVEAPNVLTMTVGARFFGTTGIRPVIGQVDEPTRDATAVLGLGLATHLFGSAGAAVGRTVFVPSLTSVDDEPLLVAGVVEDARHVSLRGSSEWTMYYHAPPQVRSTVAHLAVRTSGDAARLTPRIQEAVRAFGDEAEVVQAHTLDEVVERSMSTERFLARASAGAGLLALLLAVAGIAGMVAFGISQRRTEIAIRMAVGARAREVTLLMLLDLARPASVGLLLGVLATGVTMRGASALLFGVEPFDVVTLATTGLLLAAAAGIACWIPAAIEARRTDPVATLRAQ